MDCIERNLGSPGISQFILAARSWIKVPNSTVARLPCLWHEAVQHRESPYAPFAHPGAAQPFLMALHQREDCWKEFLLAYFFPFCFILLLRWCSPGAQQFNVAHMSVGLHMQLWCTAGLPVACWTSAILVNYFNKPIEQCTPLAFKCFTRRLEKEVTLWVDYSSDPKFLGCMSFIKIKSQSLASWKYQKSF